jgi:hypothetical protein
MAKTTNRSATKTTEPKPAAVHAPELKAAAMEAVEDLSVSEARLLEALANPELRGRPVRQIAEAAGISQATYFRAMARQEFREKATRVISSLVLEDLSPVVSVLVMSAQIPGKEGAADRRLLLELSGAYQPTRRNLNEDVTPDGRANEAKCVAAMLKVQAPAHAWPEVVLVRWVRGMTPAAPPLSSPEAAYLQLDRSGAAAYVKRGADGNWRCTDPAAPAPEQHNDLTTRKAG